MNWKTILLAAFIGFTLFASRSIFYYQFDQDYLTDFYNLSQWKIPLSSRTMSDNELYQVASWQLLSTRDIFSINPEVPPLGKFIYSASLALFANPYYSSLLLYAGCIVILLLLGKKLFSSTHLAVLATLLVVASPMFFAQLSLTMLDLPQLFFFLIHIYLFLHILSPLTITKGSLFSRLYSIESLLLLAGISLGLFSTVKIGVYVPFILFVEFLVLRKKIPLYQIFWLILGGVVGYVLPFLPYIFEFGVLEWMRNEKWMLNFYLSSNSARSLLTPFMIFISSVTGWYQGWWNQGWQHISEWTILWPITLLAFFWNFKSNLKRLDSISYLQILGLGLIAANILLPFWPRYYLLLLPIGSLLFIHYFKNSTKLVTLVIAGVFLQGIWFQFPQPSLKANFLAENFEKATYHELYQSLSDASKKNLSRQEFYLELKQFDQELAIASSSAELIVPKALPWENKVPVTISLQRYTPLGILESTSSSTLVKENNVWKLDWNWNIVYPNWDPQNKIVTEYTTASRSALKTNDEHILMEYRPTQFITIHRPDFTYSSEAITTLSEATGISTVELENRFQVEYQYFDTIPLGFLRDDFDLTDSSLEKMSGLSFVEKPKLIISKLSNQELTKLESLLLSYGIKYDQDSGSATMIDAFGNQTLLLQQSNLSAEDLKLDQTFFELFQREENSNK